MSTLLLSEARGLCALTIFFTVVREYSRTISKIGRQIQAPRLLIYTTRDPLLWCHQISSVIANTLVSGTKGRQSPALNVNTSDPGTPTSWWIPRSQVSTLSSKARTFRLGHFRRFDRHLRLWILPSCSRKPGEKVTLLLIRLGIISRIFTYATIFSTANRHYPIDYNCQLQRAQAWKPLVKNPPHTIAYSWIRSR